jgi:hypothetical protein
MSLKLSSGCRSWRSDGKRKAQQRVVNSSAVAIEEIDLMAHGQTLHIEQYPSHVELLVKLLS